MSRRQALANAQLRVDTHAGLWLDRFVLDLDATAAPAEHQRKMLESIRLPAGYPEFFRRVTAELDELPPKTEHREATVRARLVVGLGAESVLETSMTLHRIWGVPYLPGSALKGLAARAAREKLDPPWKREDVAYRTIFGDLESAGYITFHDALLVPPEPSQEHTKERFYFQPDTMTVHHPEYYSTGAVPPADWDDPNPVAFLSAIGTFHLALTGPPDWLPVAWAILGDALRQDGLGAKTAAGYGRLRLAEQTAASGMKGREMTTEEPLPCKPA